jgi:hypothetical protein
MATITPIEQTSFQQGMILGVRQDAAFEQQKMESASWIENLNPNMILGELHTRERQTQDIINANPVQDTFQGTIVSALEMTHSEAKNDEKAVLHIFSDGSPSIRTSDLTFGAFNNGVWSDGSIFEYPPSDYDVYGESVLITSNTGTMGEIKRKPVYAYTYKDYEQYYGQKNEAGKELLLSGITKPSTTLKRWEVLNEAELDKIIEAVFETEDITEVNDYLTAEVPKVSGIPIKMVGTQHTFTGGAAIVVAGPPQGPNLDAILVQTTYKIKSGSDNVSIIGWGCARRADEFIVYENTLVLTPLGAGLTPMSDNLIRTIYPVTKPLDPFTPLPEPFPVMWGIKDYVKNKKPRRWFPGERIPYIITAVVNGIEKIIKKDNFDVFGKDFVENAVVSAYDYVDLLAGTTPTVLGHADVFPISASKEVHFNLRINAKVEDLPIGLSELRLYIANKNIQDAGLIDYAYAVLPAVSEVNDPVNTYKAWVKVSDMLYRNPDSDREQFSYSLAKSFVVFGDPDLYKRRAVDTGHNNYGVNNVSVNEWEDMGTYLQGKNTDGGVVRSEFYIWDYMNRTADPIATNLGNAIALWKGKGAAVIASMKGATFIAGCLDTLGKLEVGLIRKSLLQGAVQSTDTFVEVDYLKVGNETHTALIEFRGQLWAYSRTQVHRIQLRDMSDLDTTEVLEVLEGNGTFSPKTVIACPYGVVWLNESGVWLSNGGEPRLLSKEIEPLYLSMVRGKEFIHSSGDVLQFSIGSDLYNKTLQVVYDPLRYDIVVSCKAARLPCYGTPAGEDEQPLDFRLIYSVTYKNWRIETFRLQLVFTDDAFGKQHRTHFARTEYKSLGITRQNFQVNKTTEKQGKDFASLSVQQRLTLHEIGNGVNDMQINAAATEAAYLLPDSGVLPKLYLHTKDNIQPFVFEGAQGVTDPLHKGDLVSYTIPDPTSLYWTENKIDTPIETPLETGIIVALPNSIKSTFSMSSQIHHVPFMKPVRRVVVEYIATGIIRLRSLSFTIRTFQRKFWG